MKGMILKCILKYIIITVNHPKILNSEKLSCLVGLFGLKSFHGFVSLNQLEDVTDCLSSLLKDDDIFLKMRIKFRKNWLGGEFFKKICGENQNGMVSFHFHFLTISYHGN